MNLYFNVAHKITNNCTLFDILLQFFNSDSRLEDMEEDIKESAVVHELIL